MIFHAPILNSGLKYKFCVNSNKIGSLVSALAFALHNIIQTVIIFLTTFWALGPQNGYFRQKLNIGFFKITFISQKGY